MLNPGYRGVVQHAALVPDSSAAPTSVAPAPAIQADAQWAIVHPAPPGSNITDVFFTLILTGQDAVVSLAPHKSTTTHLHLEGPHIPCTAPPLGPCRAKRWHQHLSTDLPCKLLSLSTLIPQPRLASPGGDAVILSCNGYSSLSGLSGAAHLAWVTEWCPEAVGWAHAKIQMLPGCPNCLVSGVAPVAVQETNGAMIKQLSYLLTDILNTGPIDYLTDDNTAVIDEHQLPPIISGNPGPGRKLLSRLEADEVCGVPTPACVLVT